jgi:3-methyladenine DNA glycosylase AlkC
MIDKPRKGARNVASVNPDILAQLEAGNLETANLTEGLAIRMDRLLRAVAPKVPENALDLEIGVVQRMAHAGALLRTYLTAPELDSLCTHSSDTVRGWAAFAVGQDSGRAELERIDAIKAFAADAHFGVREWAWMAVRAIIVAEPLAVIDRLAPWTTDIDVNVRRFASEATRPRGVWAASVPILREHPEHGLPILNPLRHDTERYVEDSVANWLNDAAKDKPEWVLKLLDNWEKDGVSQRLVKRAKRSIT